MHGQVQPAAWWMCDAAYGAGCDPCVELLMLVVILWLMLGVIPVMNLCWPGTQLHKETS